MCVFFDAINVWYIECSWAKLSNIIIVSREFIFTWSTKFFWNIKSLINYFLKRRKIVLTTFFQQYESLSMSWLVTILWQFVSNCELLWQFENVKFNFLRCEYSIKFSKKATRRSSCRRDFFFVVFVDFVDLFFSRFRQVACKQSRRQICEQTNYETKFFEIVLRVLNLTLIVFCVCLTFLNVNLSDR